MIGGGAAGRTLGVARNDRDDPPKLGADRTGGGDGDVKLGVCRTIGGGDGLAIGGGDGLATGGNGATCRGST
jgi:hypothetical protein